MKRICQNNSEQQPQRHTKTHLVVFGEQQNKKPLRFLARSLPVQFQDLNPNQTSFTACFIWAPGETVPPHFLPWQPASHFRSVMPHYHPAGSHTLPPDNFTVDPRWKIARLFYAASSPIFISAHFSPGSTSSNASLPLLSVGNEWRLDVWYIPLLIGNKSRRRHH